jgi:hypothetical protein
MKELLMTMPRPAAIVLFRGRQLGVPAAACRTHAKLLIYVVKTVFEIEGEAWLATQEELNIQITLRQSSAAQDVVISHKCCTTSHRTLGAHENPSDNLQTECKHLAVD